MFWNQRAGPCPAALLLPGMEILRLRYAPLRMTNGETLAFALTVISTKRTPCARGEISFFVHYYIPGMEILRLRRLTGGFTQDDGKGAALQAALF